MYSSQSLNCRSPPAIIAGDAVLSRTGADLAKAQGKDPAREKDFRRVLEDKDIEGVIIATPDQQVSGSAGIYWLKDAFVIWATSAPASNAPCASIPKRRALRTTKRQPPSSRKNTGRRSRCRGYDRTVSTCHTFCSASTNGQ